MTDERVSACSLEWLEHAMGLRKKQVRDAFERTFVVTYAMPKPIVRKPPVRRAA